MYQGLNPSAHGHKTILLLATLITDDYVIACLCSILEEIPEWILMKLGVL